ncbi:MAG TPA: terminase TerL endonuclease subunit [Salinimicrobium sp.]|nr:terminase TerL endonuclease subunit [Salinimicrobium sp.]
MTITKEIQSSIPYQYALDVQNGKIPVGNRVRQAVERFFGWISSAENDGYHLNHSSGMHVIEFFEFFLCHTKGEKGKNRESFTLEPFQQFTLYNIFAWKDADGRRRIKTVYEKVARKNGKTAILAGLGLYCLTFDDEESPEIYVGATKEAQAKICWEQAADFVYKSRSLRSIGVENTQREIRFKKKLGKFRFLGGDSKTQDGLSPSLACIDEYHSHRDDSIREVLESAMGARTNPILYIITTAGFNMQSACKAAEDVYKEILSGNKKDDHTFIMIHDLDDGDDWENPDNWFKSNPNLGVSISMEYLKAEYIKAVNQPSKISNFKTKHLNMWVDAAEVRISDEIWKLSAGKIRLKNFIENGCAGAIDLSSTIDLSAEVYVSNPDAEGYRDILPLIFCPKDTVGKRSKEDRVPYDLWTKKKLFDFIDFSGTKFEKESFWKKQTLITATPGNQIDYATIQQYTAYLNDVLKPKWYLYDPWAATQMVQELTAHGVEMHPFAQTITHFSNPTKEFEKLAYEGKFRHGGHPVLSWNLSGCVAITDPNENIRYSKKHSTKRIDPIIAIIMALAGTIIQEETNESKYNNDKEEIYI